MPWQTTYDILTLAGAACFFPRSLDTRWAQNAKHAEKLFDATAHNEATIRAAHVLVLTGGGPPEGEGLHEAAANGIGQGDVQAIASGFALQDGMNSLTRTTTLSTRAAIKSYIVVAGGGGMNEEEARNQAGEGRGGGDAAGQGQHKERG